MTPLFLGEKLETVTNSDDMIIQIVDEIVVSLIDERGVNRNRFVGRKDKGRKNPHDKSDYTNTENSVKNECDDVVTSFHDLSFRRSEN